MKIGKFANQFQHSILALILIGPGSGAALAQEGHSHSGQAQASALTPAQGALLKAVRESTERFKDVEEAKRAGYSLLFGCVSGPDSGAMGLHFVNMDILGKGIIDAARPTIVIYEPTTDGHLQLTGADFLIFASVWDQAHPGEGAPQLMGQLFHYFEAPNRFGLPAFYTLHVWAWKDNPNGAFVNWHPNVSCQLYAGQQ